LVSQVIVEVKMNIKKEKATNANIPSSPIAGISIQGFEIAEVLKPTILNPSIKRVTIYKAIAEEAHLKKPKVIKFNGKRRMFIIGLTTKVEPTKPNPARRRVGNPPSKTNPPAI